MPQMCCVPRCKATYGTKETLHISFHQLPKNNERSTEWKAILRAKYNVELRQSDRLCSSHFHPTCYSLGPYGNRRLKPNAVPSIFDTDLSACEITQSESVQETTEDTDSHSAGNCDKSIVEPEKSCCRQSNMNSQVNEASEVKITDDDKQLLESDSQPSNRKKRYNQHYFTECNLNEIDCPPMIRKLLEMGRTEVILQRRKVRTLQSQNFRMKNKITILKGLLKLLIKRNSISIARNVKFTQGMCSSGK